MNNEDGNIINALKIAIPFGIVFWAIIIWLLLR